VIGWLRDVFRDLATRGRAETGIYDGHRIFPHSISLPLMVSARVARRLETGDRVEFEVSPRTGEARRIRVYRRAE
jgi:hypothetical protein